MNIIVFTGLPGVGKSTLAEAVASKLSLPIFSVDPIESAILQSGLTRSFATGLAAYLVAETLAREQLKLGLSVVIDAVNPVQEARDMWRKLAEKFRAKLHIIECTLEPSIHKRRIEERVRSLRGIPEITWERVETVREEYLHWQEERLVLDTVAPKLQLLTKSLDYILGRTPDAEFGET
ncbi:MAG: AAA family ATPase [Oligoflexales bacterium]|nr:AAA family ATPase [Oligoflexales bacterium]